MLTCWSSVLHAHQSKQPHNSNDPRGPRKAQHGNASTEALEQVTSRSPRVQGNIPSTIYRKTITFSPETMGAVELALKPILRQQCFRESRWAARTPGEVPPTDACPFHGPPTDGCPFDQITKITKCFGCDQPTIAFSGAFRNNRFWRWSAIRIDSTLVEQNLLTFLTTRMHLFAAATRGHHCNETYHCGLLRRRPPPTSQTKR